jgi:dTDP-4-dehydrorhamnose reductase
LHNCKIIHFSTDYVFDGTKKKKYSEIDKPNPINIYGISKLAGEYIIKNYAKKFLIIRLSSLYSEYKCRAKKRGNFIEQIINNSKKNDKLFVTNEKITPTYIKDATIQIIRIYKKINNKITHISPPNSTTWFDFALTIKKQLNLKTQIIKLLKNHKIEEIKRPLNSSLDSKYLKLKKLYIMPNWRKSFKNYLKLNFYLQ